MVMAPYKKINKFTVSTKKIQLPKKPIIGSEPKAAFNWFPGHMLKAMRDIKSKVGMVDLVIEIRDARAPLVSGNSTLTTSISGKGRLILLNKANLADPVMNEKWAAWFEKEGVPYLFINCLDKPSLKQVLSIAKKMIEKKRQESCESVVAKEKYKFMIIGLPNTGKSTFINAIANRNATKVADRPGQTQIQLWVKVDEEMELLDTPGIMPPQIEKEEHKIWLSLINAIPDKIVSEEDPACYLIKYFLKNKTPEFQERFKIETFDLGLEETLIKMATVRGCVRQKGLPDLERVYKLVLMDFRAGILGKISFERPPQ
jgi:ribosome biogenesis GTPase A